MRSLAALALLFVVPLAFAQQPAEAEKDILDLGNTYRVKKDASKLALDDTLNAIAQAHARALAKLDKYGDDDKNGHILDGKAPIDRIKAGGYKYARFAENVGYNFG